MKKITINDVAKKAGVSATTVSRVLNNNAEGHMREETKGKVLKAIEKLNYTPDKYAQFMRKQKSGIVGVIVPDISNQFFSLMVRGIENVFSQNGYAVIICDAENCLEKENKCITTLLQEKVEGVILTPVYIESDQIKKLIDRKIPVVLSDRKLENVNLPYVGSDGLKDGYKLTQYLIHRGYKKIGFVRGPSEVSTARDRFEGYRSAMEDARLKINEGWILQGDYTFEGGHQVGNKFAESTREFPEAIIAANDLMAIGIVRALEEKKIKIPQDVGIAGFDNIPISSLIHPKLTTVEIPVYGIGQEAALILLDYIRGNRKRKKTKSLDTKLIRGESCKEVK